MVNESRRAAWAEISLGSIRDNFFALRRLAPGSEMIACVKADAYGHGGVKLAWEYVKAGAEYLGVATIDEAAALRAAGIRLPIVLLSAAPRGNAKDVVDLSLVPVVTTYEDARLLSEAALLKQGGTMWTSSPTTANAQNGLPCFIAVETGMGRLGFMQTPEGLADIVSITTLPRLRVEGLFSHFATADEPDLSFARSQIESFSAFAARLAEAGVSAGKRTMANSAAIMALPESHFEIVRPGIALYGVYPSETMDRGAAALSPAMSIKAFIVYLKKTPAGFPVSYGSKFATQRESLIATLPLGYADGLPRNVSGKARVLVRGYSCPIVGTICMDQCMADVTDVPGATEYDEAAIMGAQGEQEITAEEIAAHAGTIPYEILTRFGQRLPKVYK